MPSADSLMRLAVSTVAPRVAVEELPPIEDFIKRYDRAAMPYPCQMTLLKIFFLDLEHLNEFDKFVIREWKRETENGGEVRIPLDLYDRMKWCRRHGYKNFNTIVYCGGRRGGKGFIGGKMAAYVLARLLSYGNPQKHYGIDQAHSLHLDVLALSYSQAQGMLFSDVRDAVLSNDWLNQYIYSASNNSLMLQTPYDKVREIEEIEKSRDRGRGKMGVTASMASIVVEPNGSTAPTIRGRASFMQAYDELAHGQVGDGKMSSDELFKAATPSTMQFGKDALIYEPSSPWSEVGIFYNQYSDAFATNPDGTAANPHMFAIRIPSWGPYRYWEYDGTKRSPIILPPSQSAEMRAKQRSNPESFDVEFYAHFAKTENAYMNASVIESLFEPYPKAGADRNYAKDRPEFGVRYHAHADAGRSQDNFCFALGHVERGEDGMDHAFVDVMKTWQPQDFPEDDKGVRRVDYTQVLRWLRETFRRFPCASFTMDQWNSAYILDSIKSDVMNGRCAANMGVDVDTHTAGQNFQRWEAFKTACYQGWVHIPRQVEYVYKTDSECCLVEEEMKYMIVKNGKTVTWPTTGAITHGDMVDAVSTIVARMLSEQLGYQDDMSVSNVAGTAQGGYNRTGLEASLMDQGDAYMREMGYF